MMNTSINNTIPRYTPSDAIDRHDYGVQKSRKTASTGGGRAWSEDEVSRSKECFSSLTSFLGSLPPSDTPSENALQTYRCPLEED